MTKYHAKQTVIDGIKFASKKEASRYTELKILKEVGMINSFTLQPAYVLQDKYRRKDGKMIREILYIADFAVMYPDGHVEIEDVKGMETAVFKLKRKLFEVKYDLVLKII